MSLLVKKKWNWKEASEETKTEWGIVLKRYVMVDMSLFELERHFGEAMDAVGNSSSDEERRQQLADFDEALAASRKKLDKMANNLKAAEDDQNTSDGTSGDMQIERKGGQLSASQKKALSEEHHREQYGFFAIEASGQDVLMQATALQQALESRRNASKHSSWMSIVPEAPAYANVAAVATPSAKSQQGGNSTAAQKTAPGAEKTDKQGPPTIASLLSKYQASSQAFHTDLGSFEDAQRKAFTNLLSLDAVSFSRSNLA